MNTPALRDVSWRRFLRGPDAELLEELYVPALRAALRYDRCCAYFCSSVLAVAARGFGGLIQNLLDVRDEAPQPAVRLLVNEQLAPQDVAALLSHQDETLLENKLLRGLTNPRDALERNRLEMLAWLAARGWLEVRVGVMRRTNGILHAKFGLVTDASGDTLAFAGSDNETGKALVENYEMVSLGTSWQDPEFVEHHRKSFEKLWSGEDEHVATVPLPQAVAEKLLSWAPTDPPDEMVFDKETSLAAMMWHYIYAAPYLPDGEYACDATAIVEPWPHQRAVIADASGEFPAGRLLCDEVGLGKTIEAIFILRRLLAGRGVRRALLLVPAGLLNQWQEELREKGGLVVPYWDRGYLCWPDGDRERMEAPVALAKNDILLLSREWARLPDNRAHILTSPAWDLAMLDEAHAARRRAQVEREFNSGNLLLELLRDLQLRRQARGLLLLSATPMQTQPWEPWDLLTVLGIGAPWMVEFADVRSYYDAVGALRDGRAIKAPEARRVAQLVRHDSEFPTGPQGLSARDAGLAEKLVFDVSGRKQYAAWLRRGAPLGRRMHRNTRGTLRRYHEMGLLHEKPVERQVRDVVFDYADTRERDTYLAIATYIDKRYDELEREKTGKGFVMTVYRRRMASSLYALRRSLKKRLERLDRVIRRYHHHEWLSAEDEQLDVRDLVDADLEEDIDPGVPEDPVIAQAEKNEVLSLLQRLQALGNCDSKLDRFLQVLEEARSDGRPALVFTEYTDTMDYLANMLRPTYGTFLGCYSGEGGKLWNGGKWLPVGKAEITQRLAEGKLQVLLCTDAASEGLNLQAAGAVINYDLPWNPSKVEQRIGRADRIGQTYDPVRVRNMLLKDSVDQRVYEVLANRCGLFTHFVGYMQPVLSLARSILRQGFGKNGFEESLALLNRAADEMRDDSVTVHSFVESEPAMDEMPVASPPVMREDIVRALKLLEKAKGRVYAKHDVGSQVWHVAGIARRHLAVSIDEGTLSRQPKVQPLGIVRDATAEQLLDRLPLGAGLPLVLAYHTEGPYRCAEARWVHTDGEIEVVRSASRLERLAKGWSGTAPPPSRLLQAEKQAQQAAMERVAEMKVRAARLEREGLERQVMAARTRLMRELARTLVCISTGDLSDTFRARVRREGQQQGLYHRALRALGDYPDWPEDVIADSVRYRDATPEKDQNARIAGSEIDAALNDPRWRAVDALQWFD